MNGALLLLPSFMHLYTDSSDNRIDDKKTIVDKTEKQTGQSKSCLVNVGESLKYSASVSVFVRKCGCLVEEPIKSVSNNKHGPNVDNHSRVYRLSRPFFIVAFVFFLFRCWWPVRLEDPLDEFGRLSRRVDSGRSAGEPEDRQGTVFGTRSSRFCTEPNGFDHRIKGRRDLKECKN